VNTAWNLALLCQSAPVQWRELLILRTKVVEHRQKYPTILAPKLVPLRTACAYYQSKIRAVFFVSPAVEK
jgi:hypothetical protein